MSIFRVLSFCILIASFCFNIVYAQEQEQKNYNNYIVKANYSIRIIQYVNNWDGIIDDKELLFCIIGNKVFYNILKSATKDKKTKYKINIVNISSVNNLDGCNILYVSNLFPDIKQILSKTYGKSILTISENEMVWYNAIISFYELRGRIRFFVNYDALKKSSLILSAKFLLLANIVNLK